MKIMFAILLTLAALHAKGADPKREAGLSVHMLPDSVAELTKGHGGFTVTDPATNRRGKTYAEPKELLAYFKDLPASVQQNGIWIVTTDPDSYSDGEKAKLKSLIKQCVEKKIPIFTCRGSELPEGWRREKGA